MSELVRTPEIIATEINAIKNQTVGIVLAASIEIGRRLAEAKAIVGHGQWLDWLAKTVDYSDRRARQLIKIYEEYGDKGGLWITSEDKSASGCQFDKLSYSQAVAMLVIKDVDEREEFVKNNDVENMSKREFEKAIKELQETKEKLKQTQKNADIAMADAERFRQRAETANNEKNQVVENAKMNISRIDALEKQLSEKRTELAAKKEQLKKQIEAAKNNIEPPKTIETVEVIPKETIREIEELKKKLHNLAASEDRAVMKYRILFEQTKGAMHEMLETLSAIENTETKEKYKAATVKMLGILQEAVNNA